MEVAGHRLYLAGEPIVGDLESGDIPPELLQQSGGELVNMHHHYCEVHQQPHLERDIAGYHTCRPGYYY